MAGAMKLDRELAGSARQLGPDIGESQRFLDRMPIGPASGDPDQLAIAIDRLVAAAVRIGGGNLEIDQLQARPLLLRLERPRLADEVLAKIDKSLHRPLDHRDLVCQLT